MFRKVVQFPFLEILKTDGTQVWTTCSGWPCFEQGVGQDDLQSCLPNSMTLWFYSMKVQRSKSGCLNLNRVSKVTISSYWIQESYIICISIYSIEMCKTRRQVKKYLVTWNLSQNCSCASVHQLQYPSVGHWISPKEMLWLSRLERQKDEGY